MTNTPNPGDWPNPNAPGVPANPERDGWHWVRHHLSPPEDLPLVRYWDAAEHDWPEYFEKSETYVATRYRYLGPCLTPAEVAAQIAAAKEDDAREDAFNEGLDEGATRAIKCLANALGVEEWEGGDGTETWDGDVSVEIYNVLKIAGVYEDENGTVATHALIAAAKADGMRKAAEIALDVEIYPGDGPRTTISAAILAAIGETKP